MDNETGASVLERFDAAIILAESAPADAIVRFQELQENVASLALFSSNEGLEDISTKSLSLLTLEFHLAMAYQSLPTGPGQASQRKAHVVQSIDLFSSFLQKLEQLELLSNEQTRGYHDLLDVSSSSEHNGPPPQISAGKYREAKIARFHAKQQAQKEVERLKSLQQRRTRLGTMEDEEMDGYDQEGLERQVTLQTLSVHGAEALDEWYQALRELPMLEMACNMEQQRSEEERHGGGSIAVAGSNKDERTRQQPPLSAKPLQLTHITQNTVTGELQVRKEEIRSKVFQPGWNQPTMTLEELGEIEMKQAIEREARQKIAEAEQKYAPRRYEQLVRDGMEDNVDLVDASAKVDREWDKFKDANPRGSGNKMGDRGDRNF